MTAMRNGMMEQQPQFGNRNLPPVPPSRGNNPHANQQLHQQIESIFEEVSGQTSNEEFASLSSFDNGYGNQHDSGHFESDHFDDLPVMVAYDHPPAETAKSRSPSQALANIDPSSLFHHGSGSTSASERSSLRTLKLPEESSLREITSHLRALIESHEETQDFNTENRSTSETRIKALLEVMEERKAVVNGKLQTVSAEYTELRNAAHKKLVSLQQDRERIIRAKEKALLHTSGDGQMTFEDINRARAERNQAAAIRERDLKQLRRNIAVTWSRVKQSYDGQEGVAKMQFQPDLENIEDEIKRGQDLLDSIKVEHKIALSSAQSNFIRESSKWFSELRRREPRHPLLRHDPRQKNAPAINESEQNSRDRGRQQRQRGSREVTRARGGRNDASRELEGGRNTRHDRDRQAVVERPHGNGSARPSSSSVRRDEGGQRAAASRPSEQNQSRNKNKFLSFANRHRGLTAGTIAVAAIGIIGLANYEGPSEETAIEAALNSKEVAISTPAGSFNVFNGDFYTDDPKDDLQPTENSEQTDYSNFLRATARIIAEGAEPESTDTVAFTSDVIPIDTKLGDEVADDMGITDFKTTGGNDEKVVYEIAARIFNERAVDLFSADDAEKYAQDKSAFYADMAKSFGIADEEQIKKVVELSYDYEDGVLDNTPTPPEDGQQQ